MPSICFEVSNRSVGRWCSLVLGNPEPQWSVIFIVFLFTNDRLLLSIIWPIGFKLSHQSINYHCFKHNLHSTIGFFKHVTSQRELLVSWTMLWSLSSREPCLHSSVYSREYASIHRYSLVNPTPIHRYSVLITASIHRYSFLIPTSQLVLDSVREENDHPLVVVCILKETTFLRWERILR